VLLHVYASRAASACLTRSKQDSGGQENTTGAFRYCRKTLLRLSGIAGEHCWGFQVSPENTTKAFRYRRRTLLGLSGIAEEHYWGFQVSLKNTTGAFRYAGEHY
jgi:hypothetical protein